MPAIYTSRFVNLERSDYLTVRRLARERGLGEKGFSPALRLIIREWETFQAEGLPPHLIDQIQRLLAEWRAGDAAETPDPESRIANHP